VGLLTLEIAAGYVAARSECVADGCWKLPVVMIGGLEGADVCIDDGLGTKLGGCRVDPAMVGAPYQNQQ
jgi:hypothetical protein